MRALRRARRLREVLARVLPAAGRDLAPPAGDVRRLNAFLAAALEHRRLEIHRTGFVWSWANGEDDTFDSLLWPIVLAAADLLASDGRTQVHECGGEDVGGSSSTPVATADVAGAPCRAAVTAQKRAGSTNGRAPGFFGREQAEKEYGMSTVD